MQTLLIVIHLMIVLALVGVVLMQRSEGGGLGIGGGSGFMTARGASNALTRTTAILAALFFATSLSLSLLARYGENTIDILDRLPSDNGVGGAGILDQLGGDSNPPAPPSNEAQPATPPAAAPQPVAPPSGEAQPAMPPAAQPETPPAAQPAPAAPAGESAATPPSGQTEQPAQPAPAQPVPPAQ